MGYWVAFQVSTMTSTIRYKSNFRMGNIILRRVLMIPYEMLLMSHLRNIRSIALLGSDRGRVGGLGDSL